MSIDGFCTLLFGVIFSFFGSEEISIDEKPLMVNSLEWPILIMGSRVALPPIKLDPREDTQVELQDANPLELDAEEDAQVTTRSKVPLQDANTMELDEEQDEQVPLQDANKDELQMRWSGFIPGSREDGDANISKTVHKKTDNNKRQKLELLIPDDDATEVADDAQFELDPREDTQVLLDPSERNDVILMKCLLKQAKWKYQGKRVDQPDAPLWFRQNQVAGSPDQTSASETEWDGNEKYEPQGRSPSSSEETL